MNYALACANSSCAMKPLFTFLFAALFVVGCGPAPEEHAHDHSHSHDHGDGHDHGEDHDHSEGTNKLEDEVATLKKAVAKKESGDLKVDKTSKAGYDRSNVAEVIKRLKQMAKEDTNRFDKMGLDETLERLEASERVAASVDAALAQESARKRALLSAFLELSLIHI